MASSHCCPIQRLMEEAPTVRSPMRIAILSDIRGECRGRIYAFRKTSVILRVVLHSFRCAETEKVFKTPGSVAISPL